MKRNYFRNKELCSAVGECLGAVLLFASAFAFCWLCCACSGYHWE